jgi:hypothetical protein
MLGLKGIRGFREEVEVEGEVARTLGNLLI